MSFKQPKKEKDLQKEVTELSKQIKTIDSMLNGYQRGNERMLTKDNLQKKEIDQYQTELQDVKNIFNCFNFILILLIYLPAYSPDITPNSAKSSGIKRGQVRHTNASSASVNIRNSATLNSVEFVR